MPASSRARATRTRRFPCSTRSTSSPPGSVNRMALREKITNGKPIERAGRRPGRRRLGSSARSRRRAQPRRRRAVRSALSATGAGARSRTATPCCCSSPRSPSSRTMPRRRSNSIAGFRPNSPLKRISELQLGLNLADLDRHDEAITHLKARRRGSRRHARLSGAWRRLCLEGGFPQRRRCLRQGGRSALKIPTSTNWNIFYQRGIAYERLKEWPKAEPNFRKALELFPNQPQVMNYLGYSWVDMNMNLEEGLDMIRKAVDLRPSDGYIVDSLGWAYFRLGKYRRLGARTRARRLAEAGRRRAQRPSRRCLLARWPPAGGDVPVDACARHEAGQGRSRQRPEEARWRACRRSKARRHPIRRTRRRRRQWRPMRRPADEKKSELVVPAAPARM